MIFLVIALWAVGPAQALYDLHGPIVYLMDWKYTDVATECSFLQKHGFGGVMVSPPTEHVVTTPNKPIWHERYEVISYNLQSRSGSTIDFGRMVRTCFTKNIKVFVEIVLNNMANIERQEIVGSGGSKANPSKYDYPDFKGEKEHFNRPCKITSFKDATMVRECQVAQLADLNAKHPHVRKTQVELLNYLLIDGVAGFFVDKSKFMWPWELGVRQMRTRDRYWSAFPRPIMMYNVEDRGNGEAVKYTEYTDLGLVSDYKYGEEMATLFRRTKNFIDVIKKGTPVSDWIQSDDALVFVNNVYTFTTSKNDVLKYNQDPENFKFATALMLALGHGQPMILSTYKMQSDAIDQAGPPVTATGEVQSPGVECKFGWNCEHRLPEIYRMALFHLDCQGQKITNTFSGPAKGQFAFTRGTRGFVAFNLEDNIWIQEFQTTLPDGEYCEVMTGGVKSVGNNCAKDAQKLKVTDNGILRLAIPAKSIRAIHMWHKVGYKITKDDEPRIPFEEVRGLYKSFKIWLSSLWSKEIIPSAAPPN